mmetsp:Transcript_646/g.2034  ORF Transcript_646/g.2034 Transcript_646/m.2034 type:complete len:151 (-) Transcript_646:44-496(-)
MASVARWAVLVLCPVAAAAEASASLDHALLSDNECDVGEGAAGCGLSALQLRARAAGDAIEGEPEITPELNASSEEGAQSLTEDNASGFSCASVHTKGWFCKGGRRVRCCKKGHVWTECETHGCHLNRCTGFGVCGSSSSHRHGSLPYHR